MTDTLKLVIDGNRDLVEQLLECPAGPGRRVFAGLAIAKERERQDRDWPRGPEAPHREQYRYSAPHVLLLEEKVSRLRALWYEAKKEDLHAEFVKVAALALRALEEVDR